MRTRFYQSHHKSLRKMTQIPRTVDVFRKGTDQEPGRERAETPKQTTKNPKASMAEGLKVQPDPEARPRLFWRSCAGRKAPPSPKSPRQPTGRTRASGGSGPFGITSPGCSFRAPRHSREDLPLPLAWSLIFGLHRVSRHLTPAPSRHWIGADQVRSSPASHLSMPVLT